jgi:acetoin utilization deacetylase AcuC-like enzyme
MDQLVWFYPQGHEAHFKPGHPERPERVESIQKALQQAGLWEPFPKLDPVIVPQDVLTRIHAPAYLNVLEMTCRRGGQLDADTFVTPSTWNLAHQAAAGALAVAEAVWNGNSQRGFALTRPPGHHACHGQGMGFCLLNNIALAAATLIQKDGARRLAIVDLDLHHGNGTQDIFWDRSDVFYLSTHQSPLFPGTGHLDEIGSGDGAGYNANFPLPPGSGDLGFLTVLDELILPLLDRYAPEMILISYGFDPHWSDPLGHLCLSAQGISDAFRRLVAWSDVSCHGRLAVILEGGYNLEAAEACTLGVTLALLGQPFSDPLGPSPYGQTTTWQSMVKQAHSLWGM